MRRYVAQLSQLRAALRRLGGYERTPETGERTRETLPDEPLLADEALTEAELEEAEEEERAERLLGPLGRRAAEVQIEQAIWPGMPETWPCRCGGRPFVNSKCPRCGRTEGESRA